MIVASRFLRLMQPPMQGPDVVAIQRRLIALGFFGGPFDGIYGQQTKQAVLRLQTASGIVADGIVGPITWTAVGLGDIKWGGGQYHICVDTIANTLSLFSTGQLMGSYPVTTGKPATPTPVGDWVIIEKAPHPGGPFGSDWMRLSIPNGGYGIHGNDEPLAIGSSVSHGCIRMHNADAAFVYKTVPIGTLVTITGKVLTTRLLYQGVSPGADVSEAQMILQKLGFYTGALDGTYSAQTIAAVRAFQQAKDLSVDGIVGPITAVALQGSYDIALGDVSP